MLAKNISKPILCALMLARAYAAVQPAPLLSKGITPAGSPTTGLNFLADGRWFNGGWQITNGSWVAYKIPPGPTRLLFSWNAPVYYWSGELAPTGSCTGAITERPVDYEIDVSSNSSDGVDGDWTPAVRITANPVTSRMHYVAFQGRSWVKLKIAKGQGSLDEVQIFDASQPNPEGWIIVGNSITAGAFKSLMPAGSDFSTLVAKAVPGRVPPLVRAGIACIKAHDVSKDITRYIAMGEGATMWGLSLGTNDAWGGGTANMPDYKAAMIKILDSLQAHGLQPVLARFTATDPSVAKWQVDAAYLVLIDSLAKARSLPSGPDLYSWFLKHPQELGPDGVHPNATGYASIQRLWAENVASLPLANSADLQRPQARARGSQPFASGLADPYPASPALGGYHVNGARIPLREYEKTILGKVSP